MDDSLREILTEYLGDASEEVASIMSKDRQEYILDVAEGLGIAAAKRHLSADVSIPSESREEDGFPVATVSLYNGSRTPLNARISTGAGDVHMDETVLVPGEGYANHTVHLSGPPASGSTVCTVKVMDVFGRVVGDASSPVAFSDIPERRTGTRITDLWCEYTPVKVIDTHVSDSHVSVGHMRISNRGPSAEVVSVSVSLDDREVDTYRISLDPDSAKAPDIRIPVVALLREETSVSTVGCTVKGPYGKMVRHFVFPVTVRSMFDMRKADISEETARYCNPLDSEVSRLITDADGPLAHAMKPFSITGYQETANVIPQIRAAFDAVRSMRFSYVSHTSSLDADYQRVRTPGYVLRDRSGNCMELSVLFASIAEAMGLEPLVMFPVGHAVPGVVLSTDAYASASTGPRDEGMVVPLLNGRTIRAVFFESTLCASAGASFEDAVRSAERELAPLVSTPCDSRLSVIPAHRANGIKPYIGGE